MFLVITFFTQLFQGRRIAATGNVKYRLANAFRSTGGEGEWKEGGGVHRFLP